MNGFKGEEQMRDSSKRDTKSLRAQEQTRVAFHNSHLNYVVIPELRNEMSEISTPPRTHV
ncbi:hypothetical protein VCHA38O209_80159 [Vibrio chagasii]|nr:hypothetical protein VCHA38O209_80159 [Vibrio chagasii]